MKQLIITNNPKTAEYIKNRCGLQVPNTAISPYELVFCASREELYIRVRDRIHQNWQLQNHAMYGNIQLHKQPYRSMVLTEGSAPDIVSLQLWEQAMERVKRSCLPEYPERVLEDFQALDFSLFTGIVAL